MSDLSTVAAAEVAVREYLLWLSDPGALVDPELVAGLERQTATATDPIDKLKALSRLEQARTIDGERYKVNFVHYAKQWADDNAISVAAFTEIGVGETILRAAGIGHSPAKRGRGAVRSVPSSRRSSVGAELIKAEVLTWTEQFVLTDVTTRVGGSPITARKAVEELVAAGAVRRLGPDNDHHSRGRAPIVYRVIGSFTA